MPFSLIASMMRWNPSVRSSVSASGFLSAAASAMASSGENSVEIVDVLGDVLGQAERMLADDVLGALGVARLERLDDVHVISDRAVGAILLADRLAADHVHVGEQVLRQADQHGVAAELDDGLVEIDVDLGIFVELGVQLVA